MLNRYSNMVLLSDASPEKLLEQIKSMPYEMSILSIYGLGDKHYAYVVLDRPVKIVKKKPVEIPKRVDEIRDKLNLKEN